MTRFVSLSDKKAMLIHDTKKYGSTYVIINNLKERINNLKQENNDNEQEFKIEGGLNVRVN